MSASTLFPLFPLTLLPLPGELVPLHIFEPRYRQLLQDSLNEDARFGIFCTHAVNRCKIGSVMKVESVIRYYPRGESDIVTKCVGLFSLETLFDTYKHKLYPGGDVCFLDAKMSSPLDEKLYHAFIDFMALKGQNKTLPANIYQVAEALELDLESRYRFLIATEEKREKILLNRIKLSAHVFRQELNTKDIYHLN